MQVTTILLEMHLTLTMSKLQRLQYLWNSAQRLNIVLSQMRWVWSNFLLSWVPSAFPSSGRCSVRCYAWCKCFCKGTNTHWLLLVLKLFFWRGHELLCYSYNKLPWTGDLNGSHLFPCSSEG